MQWCESSSFILWLCSPQDVLKRLDRPDCTMCATFHFQLDEEPVLFLFQFNLKSQINGT